jgi:hypothetical protein
VPETWANLAGVDPHLELSGTRVRLGLETALRQAVRALDEQAHTASRYGVKIGTDGRPPPVLAGSPADAAAASERHWALAYRQAFEQAVADARQARRHAASQLTDLCATISGPVRELNDRSRAPLIGWPRTPWPRPRRG